MNGRFRKTRRSPLQMPAAGLSREGRSRMENVHHHALPMTSGG
jgi:hypothetical protein